jgi:hypothetical protein
MPRRMRMHTHMPRRMRMHTHMPRRMRMHTHTLERGNAGLCHVLWVSYLVCVISCVCHILCVDLLR